MAAPLTHAQSSAKRWGGTAGDYMHPHLWMDELKGQVGDFRHRALRHHGHGIDEYERTFGYELTLHSDDVPRRVIPVRWVLEQHLIEDFGRIPTLADWLRCLQPEPWMTRSRRLSEEVAA